MINGKQLHPTMAEKVEPRFEAGFYDDAVLNAYKVVEVMLREKLGVRGGTSVELITQAFSKDNGTLQDPNALPSEREALYFFFRGAFGLFRNPQGHEFPNLDESTAFDHIVVANQLLLLIDKSVEDTALQGGLVTPVEDTSSIQDRVTPSGISIPSITWRGYPDEPHRFLLDTDNDGQTEFVVVSAEFRGGQPLKIYDQRGTDFVAAEVEADKGTNSYGWPPEDIVLVDIDGDGKHEIMAALGGDTTSALRFYKYVDDKYVIMRPSDHPEYPSFIDAHIADIDHDGRIEIISQPWASVPDEFWPHDQPRTADTYDWGRVQYVYRWDPTTNHFEYARPPELKYIGGR